MITYSEKGMAEKGNAGIQLSFQNRWTLLIQQWSICIMIMDPNATYIVVVIDHNEHVVIKPSNWKLRNRPDQEIDIRHY
jgi:hypothetical protein